jgi:hypothetical protein
MRHRRASSTAAARRIVAPYIMRDETPCNRTWTDLLKIAEIGQMFQSTGSKLTDKTVIKYFKIKSFI